MCGVLFMSFGKLCRRHCLANWCCVLNMCRLCYIRVLWLCIPEAGISLHICRGDDSRLCTPIYNKTLIIVT